MAYDERLAERIRNAIGPRADVTEKKMFGGVAFLLDGKMFIGIVKDELMVRVGPDGYERALARAHVRPMDFTGKPMVGYVFVAPAGCATERAIKPWSTEAATFVATVKAAPKKKKAAARPRPGAKAPRPRRER